MKRKPDLIPKMPGPENAEIEALRCEANNLFKEREKRTRALLRKAQREFNKLMPPEPRPPRPDQAGDFVDC